MMNTTLLQYSENVILSPEVLSLLRRYHLIPHLLRGIVINRAIAPFSCAEVERKAAISQFREQHQLVSLSDLNAWLQKHQLTREEMEELAIRHVLIAKFKSATWGNRLESYFLKRKADLDQVVYSLIRIQDGGLAQELYFRIREGEQSFAQVAQQYSQGAEVHTNGLLGPIPLSQPHPSIRNLLAVSQPGQLWPPCVVADWFVIIRLEKLLPAQLDASMQQYLLNELFETWLQTQVELANGLEFEGVVA
jgi:parvulin-like peptidyl-prolyl isomerase